MKEKILLIDNNHESLSERLFAIRRLKNFNRSICTNYGFRKDKLGFHFYIYSNDKNVVAETIVKSVDKGTNKIIYKPVVIAEADLSFFKREKRVHINHIKTFEGYKNRGIGSLMLEYIQILAYNKNAKCVTLDCLQTFTDGKTNFVLRDDNLKKFKEFKKSNENLKDKNKSFYYKNGFVVAKDLKPSWDYLIPMRLTNPKPILKNKVPYKNFLSLKSTFTNARRKSNIQNLTYRGTLPPNYVCPELKPEKQKLI